MESVSSRTRRRRSVGEKVASSAASTCSRTRDATWDFNRRCAPAGCHRELIDPLPTEPPGPISKSVATDARSGGLRLLRGSELEPPIGRGEEPPPDASRRLAQHLPVRPPIERRDSPPGGT